MTLNNLRLRLHKSIQDCNRLARDDDASGYNGKKHTAHEWAAIGSEIEDTKAGLDNFGIDPDRKAFELAILAQKYSKYVAGQIGLLMKWKEPAGIDGFSGDTRPFV